jgi:hypothetical protein
MNDQHVNRNVGPEEFTAAPQLASADVPFYDGLDALVELASEVTREKPKSGWGFITISAVDFPEDPGFRTYLRVRCQIPGRGSFAGEVPLEGIDIRAAVALAAIRCRDEVIR